ncbi:hypothetical protein F9C07_1907 [Aspergillus flavus]|uniref:Uncharacterized protein n=1 Tax=Aspergillus flavus (strain ATCC 200026 / FGSC A1120 / IAM 13836 / NRRL 3357 / JCM 12722 / SRRC 167) TaxID=332952 RepID=A0A7U2MG88_ASPFN|nr:hypothetical protein F9C07_1907 [Aspergillus flavus]
MVCYFLKAIPGTQKQERSITLSPPESFRIQRTIYRREILRLLCEWTYFEGKVRTDIPDPSGEVFWSDLLSVLSPWEKEEVRCFQEYVFRHYEELPGASFPEDSCEPCSKKNDPSTLTYGPVINDDYRGISCSEERLAQQIAMTRGRRAYLGDPMLYAFDEGPDNGAYYEDYGDQGTSGRIFVSDEDWNSPNLAWA